MTTRAQLPLPPPPTSSARAPSLPRSRKRLDAAEAKLRNAERAVFALRESLATAGRETDYADGKAHVLARVAALNAAALAAARVALA